MTDLKNTEDILISYADLQQFQFTYQQEEDRLLINLQGTQNQSYRAWLSRLFVKKVWRIFIQVLQQPNQPLSPVSLDTPKEEHHLGDKLIEKRFEHQDNIAPQIEFWGEKSEGLIHTLHIEANHTPTLGLKLLDKENHGVVLHLSFSLFQVFCGLIAQTVDQANWDLTLEHANWVIQLNQEAEEIPLETIN